MSSFRKELKLSQEKFAELVGMSTRGVSKIEQGVCSPRFSTLCSIAAILKVPVWVMVKKAETTDWQPY